MLFKIIFSPLFLLNSMILILEKANKELEGLRFEEIYAKEGYVTTDQHLTQVMPAPYDAA